MGLDRASWAWTSAWGIQNKNEAADLPQVTSDGPIFFEVPVVCKSKKHPKSGSGPLVPSGYIPAQSLGSWGLEVTFVTFSLDYPGK